MMGSSIYSRSVSAALVLIVCGAVATARAHQTGGGLDVVQVRPNFYMITGAAASIMAHDSMLRRMSATTGKTAAFPVETWPTESFYTNRKALRMNDEGIEVLHQPAAHSDAGSFVFFRRSDVVVAGDIFDMTRFPVIDVAKGGGIQGEIDALNRL